MNFKTTYILFGGLVLLLAIAAFSLMTGPKRGEEDKLLSGLDPKDVTRVVVERKQPGETRLEFVRVDKDHWKLDQPFAAKLDARQVDSLVSDIINARTVTKGADLTSNPAQFGLEPPSLVVTLDAGGKTTTVNLGKVALGSADSRLVYLNTSKERAPVAVKKSSLTGLLRDVPDAKAAGEMFKNVSEYRPHDLLLENAFNAIDVVKTIRLHGDKGDVVLDKTSAGAWQFEKPAGFGEADVEGDMSGAGSDAPPSGIKPLLNALSAVRVNSGDDFIENVTDFKQYGLEPGKEVGPKVEVVRQGSGPDAPPVTDSITVGKKDDKTDKVFVRPGNEAAVAKVSASLIDPIRKVIENPSALRSRSLLPNGTAGVDAMDIQVAGDPPIELRKLPDGWKLYGGNEAKPANASEVQGLLTELGNRRLVRDFPDPKLSDADKGFDHPSVVVTLWMNGIIEEQPKKETAAAAAETKAKPKAAGGEEQQPPAPKKDEPKDKDKAAKPADQAVPKPADTKEQKPAEKKEEKKEPAKPKLKEPTVKLIFGKRDKDVLYVRREMGGTKADFAVPESLLARLSRGRLTYLDATLPSFTPSQVTKLTFTRNGETWVVEKEMKESTPTRWVIREPIHLAGRPADMSRVITLLTTLSQTPANRLWAEKATDRELERFGLKPPRTTATVALADEKDKERSYQFGAETDDKTQVYAKQTDRDLVFSVSNTVVDAIRQADLPDPTVFHLDLNKVTGMKLTGWKEYSVNGQPQTLDLEKKGANNWAVKGNSGYKLSASQAEAFLSNLAVVRAEKFVAYKSGPKPEYKLTPAEGALVVEVGVDGEKELTTLAIGGETEDKKSYYAQSNKAPGDVFLLPKDRFEKYKTKPGAFAAE
jgi:hypothetical protein